MCITFFPRLWRGICAAFTAEAQRTQRTAGIGERQNGTDFNAENGGNRGQGMAKYVRLDRISYRQSAGTPDARTIYYNYPSSGDGAVSARLVHIAAVKNPARKPTREEGIKYCVPRTLPGEYTGGMRCASYAVTEANLFVCDGAGGPDSTRPKGRKPGRQARQGRIMVASGASPWINALIMNRALAEGDSCTCKSA